MTGRVFHALRGIGFSLAVLLPGCEWRVFAQSSIQELIPALEDSLRKGRASEIRDAVTQVLAAPGPSAELLLAAGGLLAQSERFTDASAVFERCRKLHPLVFEGHYNLSLAKYALGEYAEALRALADAPVKGSAQALAAEYLKGKIVFALGRPEQALRHLTAAFKGAPDRENYALDLSLVYMRLQLYPEAIRTMEHAIKLNPNSPFVLLGLALAQTLGGSYSAAVESCRKLLQHQPQHPAGRLLLAFTYCMSGDYARCETEAAAGLSTPEPHPYLFYVHAAALLQQNSSRYDLMLRELDTAVRTIPGCTLCYIARSKVQEALGKDAAAISDLEVVVNRLDPGNSSAWYRIANLYDRTGRSADAQKARARFRSIRAAETDRDAELARRLILAGVAGTAERSR